MNDAPALQRHCPKCGHVRRPTDESCPNCGAIYAKVEAHLGSGSSGANKARARALADDYRDDGRRRMTHLVYLLFLLPTGLSMLLGYAIARTGAEDYEDEIAYAHNESQLKTAAALRYVLIVAIVLLLIYAGARASYWRLNDPVLLRASVLAGNLLLTILGIAYAWVALRCVRGWMQLIRGEGP